MNNLVYLAGPITGLLFSEATDWRRDVRNAFPKHISTLSPLRGKQYLEERSNQDGAIMDSYEEYPLSSAKGINSRDHWDCTRATLVFVNFIGAKKVSIGTVMEVAWAFTQGVPVVLCMEPDNIHNHSMIRESANFIVDSLDKGIEVAIALLSTDKQLDDLMFEREAAKQEEAYIQQQLLLFPTQPSSAKEAPERDAYISKIFEYPMTPDQCYEVERKQP